VVLLLRFLTAVFVSSFLRRRIGPLGEGVLRMRVWPNDLDLNFHANSGRYMSFMDVGRVDLVVRMGLVRKALKRGWRPIVGGCMITYRRSLLPFERFAIRSRVLGWDEKWLYFGHTIEKENGEVAATSTVRGLVRGPKGNVPPQEFVDLLEPGLVSPPLPESITRWREAETR
jgi:acyl-CoA thioesterase FadM